MMIKIFFIILGISCLFYLFLNKLITSNKFKNSDEDVDNSTETLDMSKCDYCLEYTEKKPVFDEDICQLCGRKRQTQKK